MNTTTTIAAENGRDWLDHVWGWSQFGGAILALVALVIAALSILEARRAAADAKASAEAAARTAEAAERTAVAAEDETRTSRELLRMSKVEAAKQPRLVVTTAVYRLPPQATQPMAMVQLGMRNVGERDAMGATINVVVQPGVVVEPCDDAQGNGARRIPMHDTIERLESDRPAVEAKYVSTSIDLRVEAPNVRFFRLVLPGPGSYPVRVAVGHGEAKDGGAVHFATATG